MDTPKLVIGHSIFYICFQKAFDIQYSIFNILFQ